MEIAGDGARDAEEMKSAKRVPPAELETIAMQSASREKGTKIENTLPFSNNVLLRIPWHTC